MLAALKIVMLLYLTVPFASIAIVAVAIGWLKLKVLGTIMAKRKQNEPPEEDE